MQEMTENIVDTSATGATETAQEQPVSQDNTVKADTEKPERTYSRDEVIHIVKKRLARAESNMFNKYGAKSKEEFDSLLDKARRYDDISNERNSYYRELSFMKNGVNPDKYDDIDTYFKGKGQEFSESALIEMLKTHPEWLKSEKPVVNTPKTTVRPIGSQQNRKVGITESELADKMFGI